MRFRLGLVVGFAAGYYLGARAGRTRYDQLRTAIGKGRAAAALGVERLRRRGDDSVVQLVLLEEDAVARA